MKIRVCDECGKTNPPDAWYCEACGASLSMKAIVKDSPESIQAYQDEQKAKQEILPVGLDLKQDSQHLTATFLWFSTPRLIRAMSTPFVCFLTSIFFFWGASGFGRSSPIIASLFVIIATGVLIYGAWNTYLMLCILLNTTTVDIVNGELSVINRPLSAKRNRLLNCHEISEFSIGEKEEKWFVPILFDSVGRMDLKSNLYQVNVKLRNGERIELFAGPDQAIIQRLKLDIESYLTNRI